MKAIKKSVRFVIPILTLVFSLIVLKNFAAESESKLMLSHPSGVYNHDINLVLKYSDPAAVIHYTFSPPEEKRWVLFRMPLELTALYGEERDYHLYIRISANGRDILLSKVEITIDKRRPQQAQIQPRPGEYREAVYLSFSVPTSDTAVYFNINSVEEAQAQLWQNQSVRLSGVPGTQTTYFIQVFSMDKAGNRSDMQYYDYTINLQQEKGPLPVFKVLSPLPGIYGNYQLLFVQFKNLEWVRYSLDESDPALGGYTYNKPLTLIETGLKTLRVKAKTLDGKVWEEKVVYDVRIETDTKLFSDVKSGVYEEDLQINFLSSQKGKIYYTFDERTPTEFDYLYNDGIIISGLKDAVKYCVLRVKELFTDNSWGDEYRFFYIINKRPGVADWQSELRVHSEARSKDSVVGRPEINLVTGPKCASRAIIRIESDPDVKVVYETSEIIPPNPDAASPLAGDELVFDVPYGMERNFYVKFAYFKFTDSIKIYDEVIHFSIDKLPPAEPEITPLPGEYDNAIACTIAHDVITYYELSEQVPADPTDQSPFVNGPIELAGRYRERIVYQLKLKAVDELGNWSEVFGPYRYVIDKRIPEVPEVMDFQEGMEFASSSVSLTPAASRYLLHFTYTSDGTEPPDPTRESLSAYPQMTFQGSEGKVTTFRVKLLAFSTGYNNSGLIATISFRINLIRPQLPTLSGFENNGRYNKAVQVVGIPESKTDKIFLSYTDNGEDPPDPVLFKLIYKGPLIFNVEQGEEKLIKLRYTAVNQAGNRCLRDGYLNFILDKKAPSDPDLVGVPENGITNKSITVRFASAEGTVYYSMTDDGSLPPVPKLSPENIYKTPLVLLGKENQEIVYKLVARAVDDLQNASPGNLVHTIVIDKLPPPQPPSPRRFEVYDGERRKLFLSWDPLPQLKLYYAVNRDFIETSSYSLYTEPLALEIGVSNETIMVRCYYTDPAGNKSPEHTVSFKVYKSPAKPLIGGYTEGAVYGGAVKLYISGTEGEVRYEISLDGTEPAEVTSSSPLAENTILLDAAPGENLDIRINFRAFNQANPDLYSAQVGISFNIDRAPPLTAQVLGVANQAHYPQRKIVTFREGNYQVFYAVLAEKDLKTKYEDIKFALYSQPILLEEKADAIITYRIVAYTVDAAGNKSLSYLDYTVYIDKLAVYVSYLGSDSQEGTRDKPFLTVGRAVEFALQAKIKNVFITEGEFPINDTLTISGELNLFGNRRAEDFQESVVTNGTTLQPGGYFSKGRPLFLLKAGNFRLDHINVSDDTDKSTALILQEGGKLFLQDCTLVLKTVQQGSGLVVKGGDLIVEGSLFKALSVESGSLISAYGGNVTVRDSSLQGLGNSGEIILILLENCQNAVFEKLNLDPGVGKITRSLYAGHSRVYLEDCQIKTGQGSMNALGIDCLSADIFLKNCQLSGNAYTRYTSCLLEKDSSITIENCVLTVAASLGAYGVNGSGGYLAMSETRVSGQPTLEFLCLINTSQLQGQISNSIFMTGPSKEAVHVFLDECAVDFYNNTLVAQAGSGEITALKMINSSRTRVINNLFVSRQPRQSTGLYLSGGLPQFLHSNCFAGWDRLCVIPFAKGAQSVRVLDDLNALDQDTLGGPVHGNIQAAVDTLFVSPNDYHLTRDAVCIDKGLNIGEPSFAGPVKDIDGDKRPAPSISKEPQYDIGADEVY